jgi:acetolactate synthase I/II/III large subunit
MVHDMAETRAATRIGGHIVAETLRALGAEVVFGIPGVHALPIWEGLRDSGLRVLGFRQELNAAFAADGYARVTGRPTPVVVSTGPGAFMTLAPLMEALTAFVPIVVVASQIKSSAIGKGRGELHETPDQAASFAPLVKWTGRAGTTEEIPALLAEAWRRAAAPPQGPAYVEVPYDVLRSTAPEAADDGLEPTPAAPHPVPGAAELDRAAALLAEAERPLIVAGGGSVRSRATPEVIELAERLDAPVATTYTGKGAFPERHALALGSAWDDAPFAELVADADAVLVVGSWLGYELAPVLNRLTGTLIRIDAAPERIALTERALGLVGDAKPTLRALLDRIAPREAGTGTTRAAAIREAVEASLGDHPNLAVELLGTIERVLPHGAAAAWDSTILAYTACWYLRVAEPKRFLYPAGSSTLGYGLPAALGASAALPDQPVLAVVGDGGFQYGLAELATAKQHDLRVAVLVIDDRGYGILREYQEDAGFAHAGVDLEHADFVALADSFGIPARRSSPEALGDDLGWALAWNGPAVVVLEEALTMPVPSASA